MATIATRAEVIYKQRQEKADAGAEEPRHPRPLQAEAATTAAQEKTELVKEMLDKRSG